VIPKISDFGLAKRLDDDPSTHSGIKGTPNYMAPEQAGGRTRTVGPAADIHALGAILYEMLTGRPPFQGQSLAEVLDQVRFHNARPPTHWRPELHRDLETICLKCLAKEPDQRYASAEALARDLASHLQGGAIEARARSDLQVERLKRHLHGSSPAVRQSLTSRVQADGRWLRAGYEIQAHVKRIDGGILYVARNVHRDRLAHLKVLLPGADEKRLAEFRHEADTLSRLRHPGIPEFFGAGAEDGYFYLASELVEGTKLSSYLVRSRPNLADRVRLMEALCRAVDHAHQQGVVHRDLRPASMLITKQGGLTVTQFGLLHSPDESEDPSQSQLLELLRYKAPEQMDVEPVGMTPAINIYTLGTILYEMLTGKPPFEIRSLFGAMEQLRKQAPLPPSQLEPLVSGELDAICLKCLKKEPVQRYSSAGAMADDLARSRSTGRHGGVR
jgi:eukaryotic-like serine/threonine-protein kinase